MEYCYRVWWNPQVGRCKLFYIPVRSPEEGKMVLDILSAYDYFQFNNKIKGDFCNTGGLQMYCDGEWCDWHYDDNLIYTEDVDEYVHSLSLPCQARYLEWLQDYLFSQIQFDNI